LKNLPVRVRLFQKINDKLTELKPQKDGYLGSYSNIPGNYVIELEPTGGLCLAFKVKTSPETNRENGEFALSVLKSKFSGNKQVYVKEVAVVPSETNAGLPTTRWPKNHIKLVRISDDFILRLWEVAVVTQIHAERRESNFFLTSQLVHKSRICRNRLGTIILPDWPQSSQWPILFEQLDFLLNPNHLPVFEGPLNSSPKPTALKVRRNIGIVRWYNLAYQIGVIDMKDKTLRVHWTEIHTKDRFKYLKEEQKVRVRETRPAINTYPHPRLTKFQEDAIGVSPISSK